jgi:hypothetical protein
MQVAPLNMTTIKLTNVSRNQLISLFVSLVALANTF